MATYWLSFRIEYETVNGKTYRERYDALLAAATRHRTKYWEDTSSFMVFESTSTIDSIIASCKSAIVTSKDLVLIRQIDSPTARICGYTADSDIFTLMPYLERV